MIENGSQASLEVRHDNQGEARGELGEDRSDFRVSFPDAGLREFGIKLVEVGCSIERIARHNSTIVEDLVDQSSPPLLVIVWAGLLGGRRRRQGFPGVPERVAQLG